MKQRNLYIPLMMLLGCVLLEPTTVRSQNLVFYFVAPHNVISSNFTGALDSTWCAVG